VAHFHAVIIQDDGLDAFGSHDGAHAPAAGMAGGPLFHVGEGDGCGGHFISPAWPMEMQATFLPYSAEIFSTVVVAQHLEMLSAFQVDAVFVDDNLVKGCRPMLSLRG
jgi:hypothetical protein